MCPSIRNPTRAFVAGERLYESSPNIKHLPDFGRRNPLRILIVVVFPVPFFPSRPNIEPSFILKLRFSYTNFLP
jgi:hypothetical protein